MEKPGDLVARHPDRRLPQPERVKTILAAILDRRHDRGDRQHALAQRVEMADVDVRITGSPSRRLRMPAGKGSAHAVPTQRQMWRTGADAAVAFLRSVSRFRW